VLLVCHRAPWPPDKGDRLRSHAILTWLARRHDVWLAAFADGTGADEARDAEEHVSPLCARALVLPRPPMLRGLRALFTGRAISAEVLSSPRLDAFVDEVVARERPAAALGYSSQTAPTLLRLAGMRRVLDLVDADSEKWRARFARTRNPVHWLEARRIRALERRAVEELDAVLVTTPREAERVGGASDKVRVVANGVDLAYFAARPSDPGGARIGFVGAMDYAENAQGALWFAREVLPRVAARRADAEFVVVGRRPPDALARRARVRCTGHLEDLRPELASCAVCAVPLISAHGVQNKALVAMAAGVPVVMTPDAAAGVGACAGEDALVAADPAEFADAVLRLLDNAPERLRLARNARRFVESRCDWERNLAVLDDLLAPRT
jgi:sugar transferase (PEP-CTERM/EpsH1 system associated)